MSSENKPGSLDFRTLCARGSSLDVGPGRPMVPSIVPATTFAFEDQAGVDLWHETRQGWLYGRYGNPTVQAAERFLASLEGAEAAALFGSGMAAIVTALSTLLRHGDRIAAQREIYGGTYHVLVDVLPAFGVEVDWLDRREIAGLDAARLRGCRVLYMESPTNPCLRLADLARGADAARSAGAVSVVDGTFAPPGVQRPLALGCDLVIHSGTKYLGGHGDVTAGAVAGRSELVGAVAARRTALGGVLDPFSAFLLHRGMRTLAVRMAAQQAGAEVVARALREHPRVVRVEWPGFPDHPDHALARRQMSGFGGMVAFEVAGGLAGATAVHDRLRLIARAASLGSVESLVSIPARMSHRGLTDDDRARAGVTPGLLRLSVGIEAPEDLVADLRQALDG